MTADCWRNAIPTAWRGAFKHVVAPDEIVPLAARGTRAPEWQRRCDLAYPDNVGLSALAQQPELRAAIIEAGIAPGMRVLDAACGPGVISRFLLAAGAGDVVGLDTSPAMLAAAEVGPPPVPDRRLDFLLGDIAAPLPFPDDHFDAIWSGDCWVPAAFPEFRRALRPGGRIIVKLSGLAPDLTYAFDRAFDARMSAALARGYQEALGGRYGDRDGRSYYGRVRGAGSWRQLTVRTVVVERVAPVPAIFELALGQGFSLWQGAFLRDQVAPEDWGCLARLHDPASPEYLLRRGDGHFIRTLTILCGVIDKAW